MARARAMQAQAQMQVPEGPPVKRGTVVVIGRGDRQIEANRIKMNAMEILLRFIAKERGDCEFMSDDNTMVMLMPSDEGDLEWVEEKVLRYVSIVQSLMSKADMERKVEQLCGRFAAEGGSPSMLGTALVRRYLDKYYLIQRYASVFERDV